MKGRLLGWMAFLLVVTAGCGASGPPDGHWQLDGQTTNYRGQVVLDRVTPERVYPLDSAIIGEEGSFSFVLPANQTIFYEVRFPASGSHFAFIPREDQLNFEWDPQVRGSWKFSGNRESVVLHDFIMQRNTFFKLYMDEKKRLQLIPKSTTLDKWRNQEAAVDNALLTYRQYLRTFIDSVSVPELKTYAMYSMNIDGNYHYIQTELDRLPSEESQQAFAQAMRVELAKIEEPFYSTEPMDIEGTNPTGEEVHLKGSKGKMTLLVFWASYCEYSRKENELLNKLYREYAADGFSIFSVSIDDFRNEWEAASAQLAWPGNIWQSGAWNAEALMGYDVPTIPTTYLLDARGGLVSKNIRAAELEANMPQLLEQHGPAILTKEM